MTRAEQPEDVLREHTRDVLGQEELASAWTGVRAARAARVIRRARIRVASGVGITVLALMGLGFAGRWAMDAHTPSEVVATAGRDLDRADGAPFLHASASESVTLADHSRITVSADGELEVLQNGPELLSLHLSRGHARFEVTPHGPRRWRVEGGGVSIEVVGTVFEVQRTDGEVRVSVEHGVVLVRGVGVPDGVHRLSAGETLEVPIMRPVAEVETPVEAATGRAVEAFEEVPASPRVTPSRPSSDALLERADALRRSGEDAEALEVLASLVERYPRSVEAPLAAFTAAQLCVRSGQDEAAARWYRRSLALGLSEPLAEQARAALVALDASN